jgi:hypothetical protein
MNVKHCAKELDREEGREGAHEKQTQKWHPSTAPCRIQPGKKPRNNQV